MIGKGKRYGVIRRSGILLLLLGLTGLSVGAPPEWFHRRSYREYTPEWGIVGIGSGSTLEQAIDAATADIARQIEVEVKAQVESEIQSIASYDREEITSRYRSTIHTTAQASLVGVQTVVTAQDEAGFYALCYLDKDQFTQSLQNKLDYLGKELKQQYHQSVELLKTGDLSSGLSGLDKCLSLASERDAVKFLYAQFSSNGLEDDTEFNAGDISRIRYSLIHSVKLEKSSGEGQEGIRGKLLPQRMKALATFTDLQGEVHPIPQGLVVVENGAGVERARGTTDDKGEVSFVLRAEGVREGVYRLKLVQIQDYTLRSPPIAEFRYRVTSPPPLSFSVSVEDDKGSKLITVEEALKRAISSLGHQINSEGNYELQGTVEVLESREISGFSGTRYLVKIALHLKCYKASKRNLLVQSVITAQGVSLKNRDEALTNALRDIKIDEDTLAEMLSEID
ncbi:MAG: LPP20 family lipoprotein [bacterium]